MTLPGARPQADPSELGEVVRALRTLGERLQASTADSLLRASGRRRSWPGVVRLLALGRGPRTRHEVRSVFRAVGRPPLNWTVVRCPGMTDGRPRGVRHVAMTHRDAVGNSVTRVDAARFLAAQVLETGYVCAAPAISN